MGIFGHSKGVVLAVFLAVSGNIGDADASELPERDVPGTKTTACILSGEINLAAAVQGSNPAHTQILITLEQDRAAKSPLGNALAKASRAAGVLRCAFTGNADTAEYDWNRNIVFLPVMPAGTPEGAQKQILADIEEAFHAWQITSRPQAKDNLSGLDAFGLHTMLRGLEVEAKIATALVLFEMSGSPDGITVSSTQLFDHGTKKPLDIDVAAQKFVRARVEATPDAGSGNTAFVKELFSTGLTQLLFYDDRIYTNSLMRWAEASADEAKQNGETPRVFDLGSMPVIFSGFPTGQAGHLSGFTLSGAVELAGENHRDFIQNHRPELLKK